MPTGDGLAYCLPIERLFSHHFADTYRKEPLFLGFLVHSTSSWISTCKLKKTPLKKALVLIRNCQHFLTINCMNWFDFLIHRLWSSKGDLRKHLWASLWCSSQELKCQNSSNQQTYVTAWRILQFWKLLSPALLFGRGRQGAPQRVFSM